ncbi:MULTISPECIES: PadR family transcriptional regulator [Streptomyces]|uniref:PadR-like family transcriptional regulator n=1 Tax=Streptomyces griseus TaxID=1911 RepID=A0A380MSB3_STRGR|nr:MULTISPECIES: PadR family transcriptional regulator [Streptomyces]MDQ0293261.1 DNA-binding PadR family transcriptional regulator [Streptomyces sp. DSM 41037]RPK85884.1 Transcriptional regulator YqjI [Streptomyces sp. ADI98-12]SUO95064.1 PadR-like family transcriptional regulator [Streptomyces griseus]
MPPVFAHGRLRLYLLKLLDEAPRHGYEVIRLLEERFQGLYAPSAGTVYPRLAKLEAEGLVRHTTEGGRKVYSITEAGRAELADRQGELADLEIEIRDSVAELAAEIRDDVRGAAGDLRREMRAAASRSRDGADGGSGTAAGPDDTERESWRLAKEELRRAKQEWKEQARRAKDESRRARQEAERARDQAREAQARAREQAGQAQEEMRRMARRVQDQVQEHFTRGDWPTGVREGLSELGKEFARFGWGAEKQAPGEQERPTPRPEEPVFETPGPESDAFSYAPDWSTEPPSGDPARDLDRLLDRFRDDIRDAARDHGVTEHQLREARRHLSAAAAHIGVTLRASAAEESREDGREHGRN